MRETTQPVPFSSRRPAQMALIATVLLGLFAYGVCQFFGKAQTAVLCTVLAVQAASGIGLLSGDRIALRPGFWANPQRWSVGTSNAIYFGVFMYAINVQELDGALSIWIWAACGLVFGAVMMVMAKPAHPALSPQFVQVGGKAPAGGFTWFQWAHPPVVLILAMILVPLMAGLEGGLTEQALYLGLLLNLGAAYPLYFAPKPDGPDAALWRVLRVANALAFVAVIALWYAAG